jgi:hypothetical protein
MLRQLIKSVVDKVLNWYMTSDEPTKKVDLDELIRAYSSYSGVDTRVYISDEPFEFENRNSYQSWGMLQEIEWTVEQGGQTHGKVVELNMGGSLIPEIENKIVTLFAANEYGKTAVIASFAIKNVEYIKSGMSVDDIIIEREIHWVGQYMAESVGPQEPLNDS